MSRPLIFLLISLLYISCGKSFEKNFLLQRSSSDLENSEIAYLGTYEYTKEIGEISVPEIIEYVGQRRMYSIFRNELEYKYKTPIDVSKEFSEEEMASARKGIQNANCKIEAEKQKEQRMAKKQQKTLPASSHA